MPSQATRILILLACCTFTSLASECLPETLAVYEAPGFTCTQDLAGGVVTNFSGFSFGATDVDLKARNVDVVPLGDGFEFEGSFLETAGLRLDAVIAYTEVIQHARASLATLSMRGFDAGVGGAVDVAESICLDARFDPHGVCPTHLVSLGVFANSLGVRQVASADLNGARVLDFVKDIAVLDGAVSIINNTTTFSGAASEPPTLALVGGLLVAAYVSKKRAKRG